MEYPTISVMLCAYNSSKYIKEAVDSILQQSFTDFELIIVNDGSTDHTLEIVQRYEDKRIRVISCKHNYIESLNTGMKACRGKYIARMDADDMLAPNRLECQLSIMEEMPDIAVCFSWGRAFGAVDEPIGRCVQGRIKNPFFLFAQGNYLMHPTAMMRTKFIRKHRINYKKKYPYAEDYKLWTDITKKGGEIYVIPEQLFFYRISSSQVSVKYRKEQQSTRLKIQQEVVEELLHRLEHPQKTHITKFYREMLKLNQANLMQGNEILVTMFHLLRNTHCFVS